MSSVAVIGAGMAGVSAARALKSDGYVVTVFDRGNRVGGRCTSKTRPVLCDHGAPYAVARDDRFVRLLAGLEADGVVTQWSGRFANFRSDGDADVLTRYVGVPSMSRIVETLAAPLAVETHTRVAHAIEGPRGWRLYDADDSDLGEYDALVLAMPPEQARALVPKNSLLRHALRQCRSEPCWAAMLSFAAPLTLPFDAARFDHTVIDQALRDSAKPGRTAAETWVVHATPEWSSDRFRCDADVVAAELAEAFFAAAGITPIETQVLAAHRWGFARVVDGPRPGALWDADSRIALCGDWCVAPALEGAWLSGLQAAEVLSASIGKPRSRRRRMPRGEVEPA